MSWHTNKIFEINFFKISRRSKSLSLSKSEFLFIQLLYSKRIVKSSDILKHFNTGNTMSKEMLLNDSNQMMEELNQKFTQKFNIKLIQIIVNKNDKLNRVYWINDNIKLKQSKLVYI
ncbi:MAG: hypothetical protein HWD84_09225 [Flavobacteriaceae bacterium]|nr:hypothetical protein [Flavobacteriaceae bacterium]